DGRENLVFRGPQAPWACQASKATRLASRRVVNMQRSTSRL
ncbi:unnamed protein product, partial [Tetraodon nigroviridis]